ncbi:Protein of unknown function (DUF3738) [Terriglobus roseus DSM 18391]|uniref:Soil-associated protein, TIGR03435 family n=1 Tax=Terriglobus roseus (strain DSM 18391 / NRRL B-41598 / KBS 63) TaxID=926566 RepID=I3ZEX1_TERRK|nr:TIGR03435 family protein [Terriglobus roseus]AFL87789.1 Protein of unknown function (DUF3738) [Terriglobus roseus DSM 18391]
MFKLRSGLTACGVVGCLLIAGPVPAQVVAERPSFEVTTVRPAKPLDGGQSWHTENNRSIMENFTLRQLIRNAYRLKVESQVLGGPEWIDKERFDISAKMDDEEFRKMKALPSSESGRISGLLQQSLLAERFGLRVSVEQRSMPVYALVVDGGGSKLAASVDPPAKEGEPKPEAQHSMMIHSGDHGTHLEAKSITMADVSGMLSDKNETGRRVVLDQTGLTGNYDFKMDWAQDNGSGAPADATQPGLMTALREQLGLRLEKREAEVPVVVVQSASRPQFD